MRYLNICVLFGLLIHLSVSNIKQFNNVKMPLNSIFPLSFYSFDNINDTSTKGISYSIDIITSNNYDIKNNIFHIYLINIDLLPNHIDIISHPEVCCSTEGGILTYNNIKLESKNLDNYSSYHKEFNLTEKKKIADNKIMSFKGEHGLILMLCNQTKSQEQKSFIYKDNSFINLNGYMQLKNSKGFLSAEQSSFINIFFFFLIYYSIISLYWIFASIRTLYKRFKFKPCVKVFSVIITLVLFEQTFQIVKQKNINNKGISNSVLTNLIIFLKISKKILIRIIFFLVSIGYTINLQLRLMKEEQNLFQLPKKKIMLFSFLLFLYIISHFFYDYYTQLNENTSLYLQNQTLSSIIMVFTDLMIWYGIYMRIKKKGKSMNSILSIKNYFLRYNAQISFSFIMGIIYCILEFIRQICFTGRFYYFVSIIAFIFSEGMSICLFTGLAMLLMNGPRQNKEGYVCELRNTQRIINQNSSDSIDSKIIL